MRSLGLLGKIVLLATAMILVTGLSAWVVFSFLTRGGEVTVPDIRGQDMKVALEITSKEELGLSIASIGFDPSIPPGHIISQVPDPGVRTRKNRIVRVVVS
ncbi:PASTA domain-containing protein, partial [bacterium]